jgi:hypothetical protein
VLKRAGVGQDEIDQAILDRIAWWLRESVGVEN